MCGQVAWLLLSPMVLSQCCCLHPNPLNKLSSHTALAALRCAGGVGGQMEALWKSHLNPPHVGETEWGGFSLERNPVMLCIGKQEGLGKVWASKWAFCAYLLFLGEKAAGWGVAWVCEAPPQER